MQFIPLNNFKKQLRVGSLSNAQTVKGIDGNSVEYSYWDQQTWLRNALPFLYESVTTYEAPSGTNTLFVAASSDTSVLESAYDVTNKIGTSSVTIQRTNKGDVFTITVTGTEGDTIGSLFFGKRILTKMSTYAAMLQFALKLDSPVTIDSTGTANFTFAIEF